MKVDCQPLPFPYGVLIVTILYVGFVLLLEFTVPVDCLNEPCNSEGLDSSISGFATDFWIALCMILWGIQLRWCVQRPVYRSAVLAEWSMGIAYICGGLGHALWTNSGLDDNAGQQGFYILWLFCFVFSTISAYNVYRFARQLQKRYYAVAFSKTSCWMIMSLRIGWYLVACSGITTIVGYIWCATEADLHVDGAIDEVPALDDGETLYQCLQLASAGEIAWYCTFAALWIPVSIILRRVILEGGHSTESEQPRKVYGLWNSWAALWIAIIPWTFGIMYIVWAGVGSLIVGKDATEVYGNMYGAVVYHYGMLLGYFLFHNIAYSLPRDEAVVPASSASNKANDMGADISVY